MTAFSSTQSLRDCGILSDIDHEFAETLTSLLDVPSPELSLGAAFASWAVQNGHLCADLRHLPKRKWVNRAGEPLESIALPSTDAWVAALRASAWVVSAGVASTTKPTLPLILDDRGRLYLHRYFTYEQKLISQIKARLQPAEVPLDTAMLRQGLQRLFPHGDPAQEHSTIEQRRAAVLALLGRLTVISGGPGTGKTYTVSKVLILLQEQVRSAKRPWYNIELLAPTGKAAQRLAESIRTNLASNAAWCDDKIRSQIPTVASTIHRRLGFQPRSPTRFAHGASNPLPADVVIVDEASMVDGALMAKLMEAVAPNARLILLGDKDQLASVEAGAILGDLYPPPSIASGYSAVLAKRAEALAGESLPTASNALANAPGDHMVHLTHSRRFAEGGGIKRLSQAVNVGDVTAALAIFSEQSQSARVRQSADGQVCFHSVTEADTLRQLFGTLVLQHYGALHSEASVADKLAQLATFRFLCAHREGPMGAIELNRFAQAHLCKERNLSDTQAWYNGRPILISANDYQAQLFNGDIGMLAPQQGIEDSDADAGESNIVAYFPNNDPGAKQALRFLPPSRLPAHETVYAMSVHKSQGSEFDHVALVLPSRISPVLTRELLYTAITRARERVTVFAKEEVLRAAIAAQVTRASGIRDALWPPSERR